MFSIIFWTAFTVGLVIFYAVVGFLASMCRVKWAIKHSPDWRYEDYKKHGDKKYLERAMESDDLRILYFTLWPIFGTGGCVYLIIRMFGFSPITASFVGLGFGFSEQLIHIAYGDKALIHTMLMHYASGLASSFYFYKAKTFEYKKYVWQALIAPISVHGLFNIGIWIWLMTYIYLL